jgi:hypothetical protein
MAGRLYFGRQEEIRCIHDVDIRGFDNEPLCLAYKTTTFHVGAGVRLTNDGYVLRARTSPQGHYYPLDDAAIRTYQSTGALPTPLPPYTIPFGDYVWGYLMWLVVAGTIVWGALVRRRRALRDRRAERVLRGDGVSLLSPETERLVRERVTPLLRSGERVLEQASCVDRDVESAGIVGALFARDLFAVLTNERLVLLSKKGRGDDAESIALAAIEGIQLDGDALVLKLADGTEKRIVVREGNLARRLAERFERALPNVA